MISRRFRGSLSCLHAIGVLLCFALPARAEPRVVFDETEVQLGNRLYKPLEHPFVFRNEGDVPLRVTVTKSSCGCTAGLVSDSEVGPGGTGTCSVRFRPWEKKRLGPQSFTVVLATNDPKKKELFLTMKARLVECVDAQPARLGFGAVEVSKGPAKLTLAVDCYKDETVPQILSVGGQVPQLTANFVSKEESDQKIRQVYDVVLDPKGLAREFRSSILIRTNVQKLPLLEIPVEATLDYPVKAQPQIVLLGLVEKGGVGRKEATLTVPASVGPPAQAVSPDPKIKASLEQGKVAGQWRLVVECAADEETPGAAKIQSDIQVLDKAGAVLVVVPVRGVVQSKKPSGQ